MNNLYLYKNEDGTIQRATAGEPITREYLQEQLDTATVELRKWSSAIAEYDKLAGAVVPTNQPTTDDEDDGHVVDVSGVNTKHIAVI